MTPNNRFDNPSPYDVLGVPSDADAREIRDRHNELQRAIQEQSLSPSARSQQSQHLEAAYGQLRTPTERVRIDFFLLDRNLGKKQCAAAAEGLAKPDTELTGVLKPRDVRVSHEALLGELETFHRELPKVASLHPRPMSFGGPELPGQLAISFDC